ncbi:CIC11C00000001495 [Sungouiella intermedia]|uniref:CIC11C00000001495 n=1 Tax=Sungouiella intermedia TaxID=45354 RepID=A0A1L0BZV7_9ASCO|nr:CIC11C00000001495 [[Candida] intermedia]
MLGSSKSLLRAFDTVFGLWDKSCDWKTDPPQTVTTLFNVIDAYNEKHNSIATLSSSLSDSLRTCYNTHVKASDDLSKEIFFVEILTRLLQLLTTEDAKVWLHTYLRPALNSADVDLQFVEKSRGFILSLSANIMNSEDADLVKQRNATALLVIDYILRAYIGRDKEVYAMIGISMDEQISTTHEHIERLRFVERNAGYLLKESGIKQPLEVFTVLNKHFVVAAERHKTLVILSQLSSTRASGILLIMDTPLFANLIRSLLHDFSEAVLTSDLYVIVMLLAKVSTQVSTYLSDLFAVIFQLIGWSEFSLYLSTREKTQLDYLVSHNIEWDRMGVDQEATMMQSHFFVDGEFNLNYLLTMLYGLFPRNLAEFSRAPLKYLRSNSPKLITLELLQTLEEFSFPEGFDTYVSNTLKDLCRRFMVHPNLLNLVSLDDELKNPLEWIMKINSDKDNNAVGEEEILLQCYLLNPDLIITIPDSLVLPKWMSERFVGTNEGKILSSGDYSHKNSIRLSLSLVSEDSDRPKSFSNLSVPVHWEKLDRRVSIVPTKLIIENKSQPASEPISRVNFKSVNFGTSSNDSLETATLDEIPTSGKQGSISELYLAHERLFTANGPNSNALGIDMKQAPTATGSIQTAKKTASDLLNEQLKLESDSPRTVAASPKLNGSESNATFSALDNMGSALDFYQRELLLIKNELEFSSYMKHLNKFNYLKLKLRVNRFLRDNKLKIEDWQKDGGDSEEMFNGQVEEKLDADAKESSNDQAKEKFDSQDNEKFDGQSPQSPHEKMRAAGIDTSFESPLEVKTKQNMHLSARIKELSTYIEELEESMEKFKIEVADTQQALEAAKQSEIVSEEQLRKALNEIQVLQKDHQDLAEKVKTIARGTTGISNNNIPASSLDQHEKEIFDLRTEIRGYKDENARISQQLEQTTESLEFTMKSYEKQLATMKLDKGQAVREMSSHYERKIHELNIAIATFESTLEERNARIMQLSTSKPIRIPDSRMESYQMSPRHNNSVPKYTTDFHSSHSMHDYFNQRGSAVSMESSSLSSNPSNAVQALKHSVPHTPTSRQSSTQNIPIIRGRGGYQKRSKKIM